MEKNTNLRAGDRVGKLYGHLPKECRKKKTRDTSQADFEGLFSIL
jgi:hypothetical protein